MTRTEINIIIEYLKSIQENYIEGEGYERHPLPEWNALDNAINILKQETNIDIIDKIYVDIQRLRGCSCTCSDGIIDDIENILDKYIAESEEYRFRGKIGTRKP